VLLWIIHIISDLIGQQNSINKNGLLKINKCGDLGIVGMIVLKIDLQEIG
jgi:hypothetical protein